MSFRELSFDFSSFQGKSVLIYGTNKDIKGESVCSNGSGKSTLMNVLLFSLYGDILNSLKSMRHIRNRNATPKDDVEVTLHIISNGVEYGITRMLRGKKCDQELRVLRRANSDSEWENITLSTIAETQRMIESDIILCGKEGFLRCILLTADQNYNFFKLNKAAKNQFFESLFELTTYSDMYNRLHRMTLDENSNLMASSRTIDNLNESIAKLERDIEYEREHKESLKKAKERMDAAKAELDAFESEHDVDGEIRRIDADIAALKKRNSDKLKSMMAEFDARNGITKLDQSGNIVFDGISEKDAVEMALDEFDTTYGITLDESGEIVFEDDGYASLVEQGRQLKERVSKGTEMMASLLEGMKTKENAINSMEQSVVCDRNSIDSMRRTIKNHSRITDILCDDCVGKYRKSVNIDTFDADIAELERKIDVTLDRVNAEKESLNKDAELKEKYAKGIEKLNASIETLREKVTDILTERKNIKNERELCKKNAITELRMAQRELQSKRNGYKSELSMKMASDVLAEDRRLTESKNSLINMRDSYTRRFTDAEYQYEVLSQSISKEFNAPMKSLNDSLEKTKREFDVQKCSITHYRALEEILKPDNIRKMVVADMLKELNFRICGYLSKMGSDYTCMFNEDFDATFTSSNGKEAEYNNFSSGEKMRLGIACCLAFRDFMQVRLDLHPNILAIDEYIDSNLDPMAVNGVMDMIRYMVGTEKIGAFIISHRSEVMQDMFDSEIHVTKTNGESTIDVEGAVMDDRI